MIRIAKALDARRRGLVLRRQGADRRGQDGFALMFVLATIALTALVTSALLGLLLTTIRVTQAYETSAREQRAADGAIEAAIAQMRLDPSGVNPCTTAAPVDALANLSFDQRTAGTGDDVDVEVVCAPASSGEAGSTSDQVRLVGAAGYQGDIDWAAFPWAEKLGSTPSGLAGSNPNLVHSGDQPLAFLSGVTVRGGAAVLGDPATGAVAASGQYLQGSAGVGGSGCGVLGTPNQAGWIDDLDHEPTCSSAEAADVYADLTDPQAGFAVSPGTPSVPSCSGAVVTFQPGRYDAARTRAVNALTGGGCTGRTFHFTPGVYYFDADSGTAGASRHGLVFGDASSYYVFGQANGWNGSGVGSSPAATQPDASLCTDTMAEPSAEGATLVLSGRTEIHHLAGRVAICPNRGGGPEPLPAIYQETSVPSGVRVVGWSPWQATFRCPTGHNSPSCVANRTYTAQIQADSDRPLNSARVLVTGTESLNTRNNIVANRRTSIEVRNAGGGVICTTGSMSGTPNSDITTSYELRTGGCASALTNESQLTGEIRVTHSLELGCIPWIIGYLCAEQPLTISKVQVQSNPSFATAQPGNASSASGRFLNPQNVAADDTNSAKPSMPCPDEACLVPMNSRTPSQPFVHDLAVDDFAQAVPAELADAGIDPHLSELRLMMKLVLDADVPREFFAPDMAFKVELTTEHGTRCVTENGFVNSAQEIAFDLLSADEAQPGCAAALSNFSQLQGADLKVSFEMPCVGDPNAPWKCVNWLGSGQTIQVRPPSIQHIRLAASTDSYPGTPTSQVNIDLATGSGFSAAGVTWMPRSDLDIHWKGTASSRPLFGGDLVLNGLGSQASAGAQSGPVCCGSPTSRTVELLARVDGRDLLKVKVRFSDVDDSTPPVRTPGHTVTVLEWEACRGSGCGTPPPGG